MLVLLRCLCLLALWLMRCAVDDFGTPLLFVVVVCLRCVICPVCVLCVAASCVFVYIALFVWCAWSLFVECVCVLMFSLCDCPCLI